MLYDHSQLQLQEILAQHGLTQSYRTQQVWQGLYRQFSELGDITTLPAAARASIATDLQLGDALTLVTRSESEDGLTTKFLWRLHDGHLIETVLMHYPDHKPASQQDADDEAVGRTTICVSSQAGCAMGCGFCATGQLGFDRHLSVGEIVEQIVKGAREALPHRVSNIVFMGMGEPMANDARVWDAVTRIHDDIGIGARSITISTVGIVPGINKLAQRSLPVNLAVSLHAANDQLRNQLVPINRTYPLDTLIAACRSWIDSKNRRLSFEWALIADTNDRPQDAAELASIATQLRAHVNLIPLNPTPGWPTVGSTPEHVSWFAETLRAYGVNTTIRKNRGTEIDAACGQLRASQTVTLKPRAAK